MSDRVTKADNQADPREHPEEIKSNETPQAHPRPARGRVDERRRNRKIWGQRDREPAEAFQMSAGALRPTLGLGVATAQRGRRLGTPAHQKTGVANSSVGIGARTASRTEASPTRANAPPDANADVDPRNASSSTGSVPSSEGVSGKSASANAVLNAIPVTHAISARCRETPPWRTSSPGETVVFISPLSPAHPPVRFAWLHRPSLADRSSVGRSLHSDHDRPRTRVSATTGLCSCRLSARRSIVQAEPGRLAVGAP